MASSDILDHYACRNDSLPPSLWRSNDPSSQAHVNETSLHLQAACQTIPETLDELKQALIHHLNWYSGVASPFISTFSDQEDAENWALKKVKNLKKAAHFVDEKSLDLSLYEFDTARVTDYTWVLHFRTMIDRLGIDDPNIKFVTRNEYLILNFVPSTVTKVGELQYQPSVFGGPDFFQVYPTTTAKTAQEDQVDAVLRQAQGYVSAFESAYGNTLLASELFEAVYTSLKSGQTVSKMVLFKMLSLRLSSLIEFSCANKRMSELVGLESKSRHARYDNIKIGYHLKVSPDEKNPKVTAAQISAVEKSFNIGNLKPSGPLPQNIDDSFGLENLKM